MKKKESPSDVLGLFRTFKTNVLDIKRSHEQMIAEVAMMKFKIRPLQGDISRLNFANTTFVETVWQLGMMDEFIEKHLRSIERKHEQAFFAYFEGMYRELQNTLNGLHLAAHQGEKLGKHDFIEMEIYKEKRSKKRLN